MKTTAASQASQDAGASFWRELIARIATSAGVDPNLALSVAAQESGLNPDAVNPSSGAVGIMQLMPATAAELGVHAENAVENILGGVRYLRQQLAVFGDEAKALAAYNWGPRHVAEAVEREGQDWLSHAPDETRRYVTSILSKVGMPSNPAVTAALPATASSRPSSLPNEAVAETAAGAEEVRIRLAGSTDTLLDGWFNRDGSESGAGSIARTDLGLNPLGTLAREPGIPDDFLSLSVLDAVRHLRPGGHGDAQSIRSAFSAYLLAELFG